MLLVFLQKKKTAVSIYQQIPWKGFIKFAFYLRCSSIKNKLSSDYFPSLPLCDVVLPTLQGSGVFTVWYFSPRHYVLRAVIWLLFQHKKKRGVSYSLRLGFRETGQLLLFSGFSSWRVMPLKFKQEKLQQSLVLSWATCWVSCAISWGWSRAWDFLPGTILTT